MQYQEYNFDGLVGPTHNYAGLSRGNLASARHRNQPSNPKAAALQGLLKAKTLADWGFPQAILPPQERPDISLLREWGFQGANDREVLDNAAAAAPELLAAAASASAMWTANACTMTPSCDALDGKVHLTPANLNANLHRAGEAGFTTRVLQTLFDDPEHFVVHPPLPGGAAMSDEGAANHTRLSGSQGQAGLHLFVYGRTATGSGVETPRHYPARQTLESIQAIARRHRIPAGHAFMIQQNPEAIDAGVFHNDVICVGHLEVLFYHEQAFAGGPSSLDRLSRAFLDQYGRPLDRIEVPESRVSLEECVRTYLFNSQVLSLPDKQVLLAVPADCLEDGPVPELLSEWVEDSDNPVGEIVSFNLRESMRNGGGPACLRQRMVLSKEEASRLRGRVFLDQSLYRDLVGWVERHYRDQLAPDDLADPQLLEETRTALDELTRILQLPGLYPFQD